MTRLLQAALICTVELATRRQLIRFLPTRSGNTSTAASFTAIESPASYSLHIQTHECFFVARSIIDDQWHDQQPMTSGMINNR
ncbi:hypothetical protein E2P81_ATG03661 [Venturia nashicola]|uniref:Uncharacterized protein n=1 Tax=Venturia nashicola TaxID=86259 RepID=A0A4Z1P9H4_9PEZI|nr:hypothetical protein E6O75_ATG03736 [Venturia nashicola]TLD37986.1 hypothetical protein E2P81_ATG03661 [Venturia nashicola]